MGRKNMAWEKVTSKMGLSIASKMKHNIHYTQPLMLLVTLHLPIARMARMAMSLNMTPRLSLRLRPLLPPTPRSLSSSHLRLLSHLPSLQPRNQRPQAGFSSEILIQKTTCPRQLAALPTSSRHCELL